MKDRALWEKVSPSTRFANVTTPTLFMGGDIDWNVADPRRRADVSSAEEPGAGTELVVIR